jgi:hypothetical protein
MMPKTSSNNTGKAMANSNTPWDFFVPDRNDGSL